MPAYGIADFMLFSVLNISETVTNSDNQFMTSKSQFHLSK